MGINISDVNPNHLPEDVRAGRTKAMKRGFTIYFFIECFIDGSTKERLFNNLKTQYGAIGVETQDGIIHV